MKTRRSTRLSVNRMGTARINTMLVTVRHEKSIEADNKTVRLSHQYEISSFAEPHWCEDCGHFLWGFWSQGRRCEQCYRCVCTSCAAVDEREGGAQRCPG